MSEERRLVRLHVVTGSLQARRDPLDGAGRLDATTRIRFVQGHQLPGTPEQRRMLRLCVAGMLTVAELAAHLRLPIAVTAEIAASLIDIGCLAGSVPDPTDLDFLRRVLHGLERL